MATKTGFERRPANYGVAHPTFVEARVKILEESLLDGTCFLDCPPEISVECDDDGPSHARPPCPRRAAIAQERKSQRQSQG